MGDAYGDLFDLGGGPGPDSVQWTAKDIDELALIFDSAQASSGSTSPSLVASATPPDGSSAVGQPASTAATPSSLGTTPAQSSDRKRKLDRERNTEAARRYRKRRVDETEELRASLAAMTKERDSLRLRLVKAETEADLLRRLVSEPKSKT